MTTPDPNIDAALRVVALFREILSKLDAIEAETVRREAAREASKLFQKGFSHEQQQ